MFLVRGLIAARLPAHREPQRPPARVPDGALRDAMRGALAARPRGRLWVFACGALMWERGGVPHDEAARGRLRGFARRYSLHDEHDRGTPEAPSLALGIEPAPGEACGGVLFRLPEAGRGSSLEGLAARDAARLLSRPVGGRRTRRGGDEAPRPHLRGRLRPRPLRGPGTGRGGGAGTLAPGVGPRGAAAAYLLDTAEALRREGMPDPLLERLVEAVGARLAG